MSDDPAGPDPEFVTVAEAARRLGITERSIRRQCGQLTDMDIRNVRDDRNRPLRLVRMAALLRGKETSWRIVDVDTDDVDTDDRNVRKVRDSPQEMIAELRARLADKDAENAYLRVALTREQETAAKLADRLADADARLAAVLVRQLPAADPQEAVSASQEPESGAGEGRRGEGAGDRSAALPAHEEKPLGFWARLWRGR